MVLRIGHRGAMGYQPENTLSSFKKAIELGVDIIELDIRICKTKELVVIHDETVDRTTNGKGYIFIKTFKELKELDTGKGEKIPSLNEALNYINKKAIVNIEMKDKCAKTLVNVIEEYIERRGWSYENFIISSFNYAELVELRKKNPKIKISILVKKIPKDFKEIIDKLQPYSINIAKNYINKKLIEDYHRQGIKVFVWTVNDLTEINNLKSLRVDGIVSDYPDRIS